MKNKRYEYGCEYRGKHDEPLETIHLVKAPNGREVAVCKTEVMAKRVAKGLNLEMAERIKMDNFTV
jgi:hypothetical protein